MKLSENQIIFSINIADLILKANSMGIGLTFGDAFRPQELQILYCYGYSVEVENDAPKLIKSNKRSQTLVSKHGKRLAVDFNHFLDGILTYDKAVLQELGDYWESLHPKNRWGGNFKSFLDIPHYEMNL